MSIKVINQDSPAYYKLYDMTSGQEIKHCFYANDLTGQYMVYLLEGNKYQTEEDGKTLVVEERIGNIRFINTSIKHRTFGDCIPNL